MRVVCQVKIRFLKQFKKEAALLENQDVSRHIFQRA